MQLAIFVVLIVFSHATAQFAQQGNKLVGTGAVGNPSQGNSVSLSSDGNTAIVGGFSDNTSAGAVWVFTRSGGVWGQQGSKLVGTGAVGGAQQGYAVSLSSDGNTALVGGNADNSLAGAAWVFTRSGGVWAQQGSKLVGTGAVGASRQGASLSLSSDGNTAIVGGPLDNSLAGAVWVFTRSGAVWSQQGIKLVGTGAVGSARQGTSVSISSDGNTAIVGGYTDNSDAGAAWVWTRSGGVWTQQGSKLVGAGAAGVAAYQGYSVSLSSDGNTAIVGGYYDNTGAGAAWVWTRSAGVWTQQGSKLVGAGAAGAANQGISLSISSDGNKAIIGGNADNGNVGAAWTWTRSGGVWAQQGVKLVGAGAVGFPQQGKSVFLSSDGNTAIVGGLDDNPYIGAAWLFVPGEPKISSITDIPVDQGGKVRVVWNKSFCDAIGSINPITSYGLWRLVPPGGVATSRAPMSFSGTNSVLATYDFIASIPGTRFDSYSYVAPTLTDSTLTGRHRYTYIVSAHTADPTVFYISEPDSGYSVDNLPPSAPQNASLLSLSGARIRVQWERNRLDPDVDSYSIYRSVISGFPVNQSTRLATTADTTKTDSTTLNGQQYYYRVTTVDSHGNESVPTAELTTTAVGVSLAEAQPAEFSLRQNYPNPFNPSTEIKFSVAATGRATVSVYSILGEQVAVLFEGNAVPGRYYNVTLDGSRLASGIYLYRLQSGILVETKKLLLVK